MSVSDLLVNDKYVNIPLTKGMFALVDIEDAQKVLTLKWQVKTGKNSFYAQSKGSIMMHRFILNMTPGDGIEVDHINRNGLDNRKENLRPCNRSQNVVNRPKRSGMTSKFKGVSYHNRMNKWQASIRGKFIGYFESELEASKAFNEIALETYGEFYKEESV